MKVSEFINTCMTKHQDTLIMLHDETDSRSCLFSISQYLQGDLGLSYLESEIADLYSDIETYGNNLSLITHIKTCKLSKNDQNLVEYIESQIKMHDEALANASDPEVQAAIRKTIKKLKLDLTKIHAKAAEKTKTELIKDGDKVVAEVK